MSYRVFALHNAEDAKLAARRSGPVMPSRDRRIDFAPHVLEAPISGVLLKPTVKLLPIDGRQLVANRLNYIPGTMGISTPVGGFGVPEIVFQWPVLSPLMRPLAVLKRIESNCVRPESRAINVPLEKGHSMVALKTERRAYLWRLYPRPMPSEAGKPVTLDEVLTLLTEEYEAKRARVFLSVDNRILADDDVNRDPKHQMYVADIKIAPNKNTITILLNRGDPNTVSPAFIEFDTSDVRVEHPKLKEAPGWSAHLVIDMAAKAGVHKACFEQMTKVSSSLVIQALDDIVARAAAAKNAYFYTQVVGRGNSRREETRVYRPYLQLDRVPSENLERDLQQGRLSHVTLKRKRRNYQGPGASYIVREEEEIIKLSTRHVEDDTAVKEFITGVVSFGRDESFDSISFGLTDLPGDQTKNASVDLDAGDVLDSLYVRAHRLTGFSAPLNGCYSKVCDDIESKMLSLLYDKNKWGES